MTSRESRKQRREAERKARKLANQEAKPTPAPAPAPETPAPPPHPAAAAYFAEMRAKADRELEQEFGAEFLAHAREVGDRIARRAGIYNPDHHGPDVHGSQSRFSPTSSMGHMNRQNVRGEAAPFSEPKFGGRSTGPRTPEGKLASSRNSLKHGLSTGTLLIPGEDPSAFEDLRDTLLREHQPADATEEILVRELAQSYWLTQRAIRYQNECFTVDSVDEKRLALFIRYGSTHERAFHKALNAVLRLQKDRRKNQSAPPTDFVSQNGGLSPAPTQVPSQVTGLPAPHPANLAEVDASKFPANRGKLPDAA